MNLKVSFNKFASGEAKKIVISDFAKAIHKAHKEKRLVYKDDGTIVYTERTKHEETTASYSLEI